jgi:hypothetical protein
MTTEIREACANCWFAGKEFGQLVCRRYPRGMYGAPKGAHIDAKDWCGEWEKK